MCCDGKLSKHFKTFGFDWKETFLKWILKRRLQIYTIKTTVLEHWLKGIIWRQEVSWPTSVSELKVLLCGPDSRWCVQTLLQAKESQWVSACRGLTDYNRILIKPLLQYWILGSSTKNIQLMTHLPTFHTLIYLQCSLSIIILWPQTGDPSEVSHM